MAKFNYGQMVGELRLILSERNDHLARQKVLGKVPEAAIGIREIRLRILGEAVDVFEALRPMLEPWIDKAIARTAAEAQAKAEADAAAAKAANESGAHENGQPTGLG